MDSTDMKHARTTMRTAFLSMLISISGALMAQRPIERQPVYSLVKQKQTTEWYKVQADLWKAHLDQHPDDREGWVNYYTVNRMLKIYDQGVAQHDLDSIEELIGKLIPNTFEYHYIAVWNSGFRDKEKYYRHLEKAQELGPDRVELLDDLTNFYEIKRDKANSEVVAKKWFASNDISAGIYNWCYNMLMSVEDNAILITFGDNDTYPAWVLQRAKGIKPDVSVINASLITMDDYREIYFKELGIPSFNIDWENLKSYSAMQSELVKHIKANTDRPVYFAISGNRSIYESFKDDIYNVGMAYKWSDQKFDNIAVMKRNYEKYFMTDYLKLEFSNDISEGVIDQANSNYQIPFITLYHHYKESEDPKQHEIRKLILRIAERSGTKEEILKLL